MHRRELLAAAAALSSGLAGCLGASDSEDEDTPEGRDRGAPTTVREVSLVFMSALLEGDIERMREFLHPDSPLRDELDDRRIEAVDADLEFIRVETVRQSAAEAVADVRVLSGERENFEQRYTLRRNGERWRIFSIESADGA
jgi:hypothetical protein